MPQRLVIATRKSALALAQTRWVANRLERFHPQLKIELLELTTSGDSLAQKLEFSNKGLFVKELEEALARGNADIAVHSMKDVPAHLPSGFAIAAIPEREDARDAFISHRYASLNAMPEKAKIGTSSLRRQSAVKARFPHLDIIPLRGNVDTRLKKLDANEYDAIVLAAAGLKRLGLAHRITVMIDAEDCIPAPGQGALAIEILDGHRSAREWVAPLNHIPSATCVAAERACSAALSGDCNVPLGAFAELRGDVLTLRAMVATADGATVISDRMQGSANDPVAVGNELAASLRNKGADRILEALKG